MRGGPGRICAAMLGVALLAAAGWAIDRLHVHSVMAHPALPLRFAHVDHTAINCVACHHNYAQSRMARLPRQDCIACHKTEPGQATRVEATFHQFCESCHVRRREQGRPGGPVRLCQGCHAQRPPGKGPLD